MQEHEITKSLTVLTETTPQELHDVHVGHYSRLGGTWWCDTCDSPYCERA